MHFGWQLLTRDFHCGKILRNQIIPKSLFDVRILFVYFYFLNIYEIKLIHTG
jgi:hypothetical protein